VLTWDHVTPGGPAGGARRITAGPGGTPLRRSPDPMVRPGVAPGRGDAAARASGPFPCPRL